LPTNVQDCLIKNTISYEKEEQIINDLLLRNDLLQHTNIVIYGKNTTDSSVDKKYQQLFSLGFSSVYIYSGGLFEWMLLQDIYGEDEFPTSNKILDILKYKPPGILREKYGGSGILAKY